MRPLFTYTNMQPNTFDFSVALTLIKQAAFVRRTAWSDGFIFMVGETTVPLESVRDENLNRTMKAHNHDQFVDIGNIRMFFQGQGVVINGWTPGVADLMSNDWELYDPSQAVREASNRRLQEALATRDGNVTMAGLLESCNMLGIPVKDTSTWQEEQDGEINLNGDYAGIHLQAGSGYYQVCYTYENEGTHTSFDVDGKGDLLAELAQLQEEAGLKKLSSRKFHRTLIKLDVLSEEPIPAGMEIETIIQRMDTEDYVGLWETVGSGVLGPKDAANALLELGSEPGFFMLNEDGTDAE